MCSTHEPVGDISDSTHNFLLPALTFSDRCYPPWMNGIRLLKNYRQAATLPYYLGRCFSNDLLPMISEKAENSQ